MMKFLKNGVDITIRFMRNIEITIRLQEEWFKMIWLSLIISLVYK